jgi:hypothetical protein
MVLGLAATLSVVLGVFAGPVLQRTDLAGSGFVLSGNAKADWVDGLRASWETPDAGAEVEAAAEQASDDLPAEGAEVDPEGNAEAAG